ncbi:hypothetical protein COT48_02735 [Candidatus Woesearchaeota archaeon CG08_land_8_20_14_0_20_47_9]|nr:MAG: hypothetical protein COT48_02735 [Candidatus Woesearchaeota archaeon CG08_land_8_20_14_0_20_47_9]
MKVFLTRPRLFSDDVKGNVMPPLSLAYIATSLLKRGHEVRIIDQAAAGISQDELKLLLGREKPGVVGISSMTSEIFSAYSDAGLVKDMLPNCTVVLGGVHASALPEQSLRECRFVDAVIAGEGEQVFSELVDDIQEGRPISDVPGVYYRTKAGVGANKRPDLIRDIDSIGFPAYNLLDIKKYRYSQKGWTSLRFTTMMTSRGCPYACTFCAHSVFGRRVRFHSVEYVVDCIEFLYRRLGIRGIGFMDDTFAINPKRVIRICRAIKMRGLKIIWYCICNVNTITFPLLKEMRSAGCVKISYGLESGDPEMLAKVKKVITLKQAERVVEMTKKAGIETLAFFMIGFPGETRASLARTKEFAKAVKPDFVSIAILCPFPGSDMYEEHKKKLPKDWKRYQMTTVEELPIAQLGELSVEELQQELKGFYREFYLRPSYIASRIAKIRSIEDLRFYVNKAAVVSKLWR